ncbi:Uncharacterized protein dnl_42200 [Desulfonema limicola]|uniref:Prevent-host-death protein n=1 Tax=Desulfonema limicola TaxID=45656 RepID=A0A975GHT1_9BACT|nr:hypothetical protein [Desulfonema limicola]QTA81866.1 Uncharacterized protein dnl_42200 [Desulfonema limicola]
MTVYNYADVCQNLTEILDQAKNDKAVFIKGLNGELFIIKTVPKKETDYNLPDIDLGLNRDEIVNFVRETRER